MSLPPQDNAALLGPSAHCGSLVALLRDRAEHQPQQVAYIGLENGETESARLTYAQLDAQARAIAAQLQSLGAAGTQVLLTYPLDDGLAFTAGFFGCLYAGAVTVTAWPPLNDSLLAELQYKAADAEVKFALTTEALLAQGQATFAATPPLNQIHWLATDDSALELASKQDGSGQDGSGQDGSEWQMPTISPDTLAYLQYTSGSTGLPKGAMITHGNVMNNLQMIFEACEYTPQDIGVCWLPLYHDMGLVGAVIQPVYAGGPVVMMSPVDFILKPLRWLQAISRYRATTSGGPNFAYELCLRKITPQQRAGLDLSSWAIAANGAEPVLADTLHRFAQAFQSVGFRPEAFCPAYGMAETTVMVSLATRGQLPVVKTVQRQALEQNIIAEAIVDATDNTKGGTGPDAHPETHSDVRRVVSCGRTGANHVIAIVNPDTLVRCADNEVGEVWVSGPSVAKGYFNRVKETQHTFRAQIADPELTGSEDGPEDGPFLRTGDMGFLQDGELFITGRLKDVIILWGNNHYPHFLESTVEQSHPALRPAGVAVFGIAVDEEERLVVVQEVESRFLKSLNSEEVIGAIRQSLAEQHMLEAHAIALLRPGSTPKTPTGKIQRRACKANYLAGELNIITQWQNSGIATGILLDPALAPPQ
ncbi:MAG: fatty acyl-AMP ligase [Cyanobacteria bacterium J06560_5]